MIGGMAGARLVMAHMKIDRVRVSLQKNFPHTQREHELRVYGLREAQQCIEEAFADFTGGTIEDAIKEIGDNA